MAMTITDDCINCGACDWGCPTDAISAEDKLYIIDPNLCTECEGEFPSPQCVDSCPVECIFLLREEETV